MQVYYFCNNNYYIYIYMCYVVICCVLCVIIFLHFIVLCVTDLNVSLAKQEFYVRIR